MLLHDSRALTMSLSTHGVTSVVCVSSDRSHFYCWVIVHVSAALIREVSINALSKYLLYKIML